MSEILPPISTSCILSPKTTDYVAAMIREGENFDYYKWLLQVREEEAQAKELQQTMTVRIVPPEIDAPINAFDGREASPNGKLFNGRVPIPIALPRLHRKPRHSASGTRITRRLAKIRAEWVDFQASRTRDAVYGYLAAVFAIVEHYKVRRKTQKLLRHAFEFGELLPLHKNADPFTAVIRCTCDDTVDSKTISKWARALRYVAHCKIPRIRLRKFMKEAGGVNACADEYAKCCGRGAR
jgi:hypothetical protein